MAEQRVNGLGQTVEFDEKTGRWSKVVDAKASEPAPAEEEAKDDKGVVTTEEAGTGDPAPGEDETMVDEGAAPQRRTRFGRSE